MSDTPRTNFVAHATGDAEWDRSMNRFGRMLAHACILERELAAAIAQRDKAREDALEQAATLVRESCLPDAYSMSALKEIADEILAMKECGK